MLGVTLRWTSIPSKGEYKYPYRWPDEPLGSNADLLRSEVMELNKITDITYGDSVLHMLA